MEMEGDPTTAAPALSPSSSVGLKLVPDVSEWPIVKVKVPGDADASDIDAFQDIFLDILKATATTGYMGNDPTKIGLVMDLDGISAASTSQIPRAVAFIRAVRPHVEVSISRTALIIRGQVAHFVVSTILKCAPLKSENAVFTDESEGKNWVLGK